MSACAGHTARGWWCSAPSGSPRPEPRVAGPCRGGRRHAHRTGGARASQREDGPPPAGDPESPAEPRGVKAPPQSAGGRPGKPLLEAAANALTTLWQEDLSFMDRRGRKDTQVALERLSVGHELLVAAFGRGERPQLQLELEQLRQELDAAQRQVQLSELRLAHTAARVSELERASRGGGAQWPAQPGPADAPGPAPQRAVTASALDYWYPVTYATSVVATSPLALWFNDRPWALFRDAAGIPAAVLDECAHRACPLSLGKVAAGKLTCPYHGWEYTAQGEVTDMPSCTFMPGVGVDALPCVEADGLIWAWPGNSTPADALPRLTPPRGFTLMAAVAVDVPHPPHEVLQALLSAAHCPARLGDGRAQRPGEPGPSDTAAAAAGDPVAWHAAQQQQGPASDEAPGAMSSAAARALLGAWDAAIPISSAFEPPCMVLSTLRLNHPDGPPGSPSSRDGSSAPAAGLDTHAPVSPSPSPAGVAASTSRLLHQVHVVIPGENGTSRVLYRLAINWAGTLLTLGPGAPALWRSLAEEVLREQMTSVVLPPQEVRGSSAASGAYAAWRASVVAGGGVQQATPEA